MQWQPFSITGVLSASSAALLYPGGPISAATRPAVGWQPAGEITVIVTHVRVLNNDSSTRTTSWGLGTSAAAVSATNAVLFPLAYSLTAKTPYDWYGELVLHGGNANHFLNALADSANLVTYMIEGEVGVA